MMLLLALLFVVAATIGSYVAVHIAAELRHAES